MGGEGRAALRVERGGAAAAAVVVVAACCCGSARRQIGRWGALVSLAGCSWGTQAGRHRRGGVGRGGMRAERGLSRKADERQEQQPEGGPGTKRSRHH